MISQPIGHSEHMIKQFLSPFYDTPPDPVSPPISIDEVCQMVTEIHEKVEKNYVFSIWTVMCDAFSDREVAILKGAKRRGFISIEDYIDLSEYYRLSVTDSVRSAFGLRLAEEHLLRMLSRIHAGYLSQTAPAQWS